MVSLSLYMLTSILLVTYASVVPECDLKFFMTAQCSNPNKPNKCPPSASCYGFEEFCQAKDEVESCFPRDISANDTTILEWCRKPDKNLSHPTCTCACFSKFHQTYCSLFCDHLKQPMVDNTSSRGQDCNSHDYQENSTDGVIPVLAICLVVSLIVNIVLLVQQFQAPRRRNATTVKAETQDDNNQISSNNSKDSVKDETEEPASPPANGALETDLNRNQPPLQDMNAPSTIQLDSVLDSSTTNPQNRTSTTLPQNDHSTIIIEGVQARYCPERRDSAASSSSSHRIHDYDDTSAESTPFIS